MRADVLGLALGVFDQTRDPSQQPTITFTGGEPTIYPGELWQSISTVRKKYPAGRIVLFTNGTRLDGFALERLLVDEVFPIVSLDGFHDVANEARFGRNQRFSELVMDAISRLNRTGLKFGISSALSQQNQEKFLEFELPLFMSTGARSLGINFVHYTADGAEARANMETYCSVLFQAFLSSEGILQIPNATRILNPIVQEIPRLRECSAAGRAITVGPAGELAQCKSMLAAGEIAGNIERYEDYLGSSEYCRWTSRNSREMPRCAHCWTREFCGGGCAFDAHVKNGLIDGPDTTYCEHVIGFAERLLTCIHKRWITDYGSPNQGYPQKSSPESTMRLFPSYFENHQESERGVGH